MLKRLLFTIFCCLIISSSITSAQVEPHTKEFSTRTPPEIRKPFARSIKNTYQLLISNPTDKTLDIVLMTLDGLDTEGLNARELALIHELKASAYSMKFDYASALLEWFHVLKKSPDITPDTELYTLQSLYLNYIYFDRPDKALKYALMWAAYTKEINYTEYADIATLYYLNGDKINAEINKNRALEIVNSLSIDNKENIIKYITLTIEGRNFSFNGNSNYSIVKAELPTFSKLSSKLGIEAKCILALTVNPQGKTEDIKVNCIKPNGVQFHKYDAGLIKDAEQFLYKPRYLNKRPIYTRNVQYSIDLKIEK